MTAFVFGVPRSLVAPLRELVSADWHERHEDVVSLLDEMRDPDSVDAFRDAATVIPAYLEFDDARALAVKAMWALGNLGTERAKAALRDLARSNEAVIQENAVKQLARLGEA
jgi:HEAT repeat protein